MHRERKKRQLVIYSLIFVLFLMTIGYAAFQQNFKIKGSTKVTSNWEVIITNVTSGTPIGNAENSRDENDNVILPTFDGLSASMSADLYESGDSMEYIVTITNRGNLDATLDEVTKTDSSNSAVIISYSGYAEGQKLRKGSSIDIKVKIKYNPEYSGGEVTGTSNISFSFVEADSKLDNNDKPIIENDTVISKDDKTLTYNCSENGGEESNQESVYDINSDVDLSVQCIKEGYTFLGWNTDKNATTTINSYTMPSVDKTLYGIYSKTIDITYKNEMLDDMSNWNTNYPELFTVSYDENTNMNDISVTATSNRWEQLYIPIDTVVGTQYTVSFDYELNGSYNTSNGIGYQAVTNISNNNNSSSQIAVGYIPNIAGSNTLSLTFTATTTKTYFDFNFGFASDNQTVLIKLGNIHIKKGTKDITKRSDTCTIYNKTSSCDKELPTIILNENYDSNGWYIEDTKIETSGSNHTYTESVSVNAVATALPVMMSGSNFQTKIDSVKSTITEIEFIDLDDTTLTVPTTIDNTTSWDVSVEQNESVIAWLDGTKMYIGGKGGVIGSDCGNLFNSFTSVTSIEFNDYFDTSDVIYMNNMFNNCNKLISLDLNSFDTSNVMSMTSMFCDCQALSKLNISNFNTSSLKSTNAMFARCYKLTTIDVSSFDTSSVTIMRDMFYDCISLKKLDLSNFDTSNVTNMIGMFSGCQFTEIDLTSFNTKKLELSWQMFYKCTNLKTIYVSEDFVTTGVTSSNNMFLDDTNLVGGNGTRVVDKKVYDKTYALIDKENQEGYFTDGSVPVIRNVSNVTTTNSITLTVDAYVPNGDEISKIEFSKDGGNTWYEQTNNSIAGNIYTFTNLIANTNYPISVRVTSENNKVGIYEKYKSTTGTTIPTNDLLFWGDASNPNNTSTVLKNKVSGTDGTMYNFNNTTSSGYNDGTLEFDGIDDYVNIGLAGYDFQNSQSYVIYIKMNDLSKSKDLFSNSESGGGGLNFKTMNGLSYGVYNGTKYIVPTTNVQINEEDYYTLIGTYDGTTVKVYINGIMVGSAASSQLKNSNPPILIGSNPTGSGLADSNYITNMSVKEALLYDRALTASEVSQITNNFNQKYEGAKTKSLTAPTYTETDDDKITITYPSGCGSTYICSYKVDSGSEVTVNSTTSVVTYTHAGLLTGYVKDKDTSGNALNTVSSTYNLTWSDLYVSNSGNDTTGYGTLSAPYATMNKAYQSAKDEATIYVMNNITATATTNFNSNKDITLTSSDSSGNTGSSIINSVVRGSSLTSHVVNETSGTLTLENITFDGNNIEARSSMINFSSDASLESGTTIKNAVSNYANGAGLRIVSGGTLTINGGEISNNKGISDSNSRGGGIFVGSTAHLIMNSGIVKNNTNITAGGGIDVYVGTFTLNGGIISNNNSTTSGGGICNRGTLTMTAGTISGNTANNGGGIYSTGTITMTGGEISNNTTSGYGGGIYTNAGTVSVSGTALIDSNSTTTTGSGNGGGLWVGTSATLNMSGGTISNNYCTWCGGGLSLGGTGQHTISGGTITGNEAYLNSGGILLSGGSTKLTMTGGSIENNISGEIGGIFVYTGSTFELDGGSIRNNIATTNNKPGGIYVYLGNSTYPAGTYTYKSGVVCENTPTNSYETHATCPAS